MIVPGDTHCHWCHRRFHRGDPGLKATKDHVVPQCMGGTETVRACLACNALKGDMTPSQWADFMATTPEWWIRFTRGRARGKRLYEERKRELLTFVIITDNR